MLTAAGLGVLAIHHAGWETDEHSRGASAFHDAVDFIATFHDGHPDRPRKRQLKVHGRSQRLPLSLEIELSADGSTYQLLSGRPPSSVWDTIEKFLPTLPPGLTLEEIHERLPPEARPKPKTLANGIAQQAELRNWQRTGEGKAHSPFRYYKLSPRSPGPG
jgi:hypothetical protein